MNAVMDRVRDLVTEYHNALHASVLASYAYAETFPSGDEGKAAIRKAQKMRDEAAAVERQRQARAVLLAFIEGVLMQAGEK